MNFKQNGKMLLCMCVHDIPICSHTQHIQHTLYYETQKEIAYDNTTELTNEIPICSHIHIHIHIHSSSKYQRIILLSCFEYTCRKLYVCISEFPHFEQFSFCLFFFFFFFSASLAKSKTFLLQANTKKKTKMK